METVIAQDATAAVAHATEALHRALLPSHAHAMLLLLSGGSVLTLLQRVPKGVMWKNVTIGVVDERFRAPQEHRNDAVLRTTALVHHACTKGAQFITVAHDTPTRTDAAQRYEKTLRAWHGTHPHAQVVTVLGMGPDGHTAGIMPFPEDPQMFAQLFEDPQCDVVGYDAAGKNPFSERVTLTLSYLRAHSTQSIVFVTGEAKRAAYAALMAPHGTYAQTPARVFHDMRNVTLYGSADLVQP